MKRTTLPRLLASALLGTTFTIYTTAPAQAADPVTAYVASKVLPDMPTINPIKVAGKLLGLVSDSDDDVKKGKKLTKTINLKRLK